MLSNAQKNGSGSEALFAIILFTVAGIGLWFATLTTNARARLKSFLFDTNQAALVTSGVIAVSYGIALVLLLKKRSPVLTKELAQSYKEMFTSVGSAVQLRHRRIAVASIPFVLSCAYFSAYLIFDLGWNFDAQDIPLSQGPLSVVLSWTNLWVPHPLLWILGLAFAKRVLSSSYSPASTGNTLVNRLPPAPQLDANPQLRVILGCRESQISKRFEPDVAVPSWVSLSARESSGGIAVFGMKGSGKTQLLLRIAEQAMEFGKRDLIRKPALCVIDIKGDLSETIKEGRKTSKPSSGPNLRCGIRRGDFFCA